MARWWESHGRRGGFSHSVFWLLYAVEFALSTLHLPDAEFKKLDPKSVGAERAQVGCRGIEGGGAVRCDAGSFNPSHKALG